VLGFGALLAFENVGIHTMITSTNNAASANTAADFTLALPATTATSTGSTDPFTQQLATALEQYLSQSGSSGSQEIDIKIAQSQVSAGRQFTVTITEPGATNSTSSTAKTSNVVAASAIAGAGSTTASTPANSTATVDKSKMTPDEAYWAEQPAAVQALRNMPPDQISQAAMALAKQGYAIDVPIMVWGWDPLTTMMWRQNYGYTWVPSALDAPVQLAPGLSFPGLTPYDANNPPAGSIKVSTDFAKGTNMQNNYVDAATIEATWSD
jgi:hypothetical protein